MSIHLPKIISNGMVLTKHARLWGTCDQGKEIKIVWQGKTNTVHVKNNHWEYWLDSPDYGGPYKLSIGEIQLEEVYVGLVFFMGGQSNMEMPMSRARTRFEEELKNIADPTIRAFYVERALAFDAPRPLVSGQWVGLSNDTINEFFAAAYFMAKKLKQQMEPCKQIPIGLIDCAVGGSTIESWLSASYLEKDAYSTALVQLCRQPQYVENRMAEDEKIAQSWQNQLDANDVGRLQHFYAKETDCRHWQKRPLTQPWLDDIGLFHGSVWFRKTVVLTKEQLADGNSGTLFMGTFIDKDEMYVNGVIVGRTEYQYPPRIYPIPEGILKEGENVLVVRAINERGKGGFTKNKHYGLKVGNTILDLDGKWAYHIGYEMPELPPSTFFWGYPHGLYNGMLAPVLPYSLSAFMWYQGESNTGYPHNYGQLLERFLAEIRQNQNSTLPFLVVQLPNFDAGDLNDNWQVLRAQQATILNYVKTALIKTMDIGEENDIHPLDKKTVGERLALGFCSIMEWTPLEDQNVCISEVQL